MSREPKQDLKGAGDGEAKRRASYFSGSSLTTGHPQNSSSSAAAGWGPGLTSPALEVDASGSFGPCSATSPGASSTNDEPSSWCCCLPQSSSLSDGASSRKRTDTWALMQGLSNELVKVKMAEPKAGEGAEGSGLRESTNWLSWIGVASGKPWQ